MSSKLTAALATALALASASTALADSGKRFQGGRQTEAPPWSFTCMTDHGPSPCGEPMWVYGPID